jgi:hypothetical protein
MHVLEVGYWRAGCVERMIVIRNDYKILVTKRNGRER